MPFANVLPIGWKARAWVSADEKPGSCKLPAAPRSLVVIKPRKMFWHAKTFLDVQKTRRENLDGRKNIKMTYARTDDANNVSCILWFFRTKWAEKCEFYKCPCYGLSFQETSFLWTGNGARHVHMHECRVFPLHLGQFTSHWALIRIDFSPRETLTQ